MLNLCGGIIMLEKGLSGMGAFNIPLYVLMKFRIASTDSNSKSSGLKENGTMMVRVMGLCLDAAAFDETECLGSASGVRRSHTSICWGSKWCWLESLKL